MKNSIFIFLAVFFCFTSASSAKETPLDLTHDEESASAKKLQHWYRHQCWRAIESYYQSHKGQMPPEELSACAPIVALSYCSQGNYTAAEAIANNFLKSPQSSLATHTQTSAMHAIALKCAAQRSNWQDAEPHYRYLLKADTLPTLPLWARYTVADTALQLNDPKRALTILTPCYTSTAEDNNLYPQITFLMAITHMRLNNVEQAYELFVECNTHPKASQLAGLAAKGRVQATQERLKTIPDNKRAELERLLLSDLQALLDDHSSLTEAEKSAALRQQAQLLAQMLRYDEANERLNKILDMTTPAPARAQVHLQIAFNSYIAKKDPNAFHTNAQQAIRLDPSLASLKSLRLALFHIYDKLSELDTKWASHTAEHLAAAYPDLNTSLASTHQTSGKRLAETLYNSLSQPPTIDRCLLLLPYEDKTNAALTAHLYANLGDIEKSIALYASLADINNLEALSPSIKSPPLRDRYNAILAYLYTRTGDHPQACTRAALAMASQDQITATLATLSYAVAGWRSLAQEEDIHPDDFMHLLELLAQLQESRQAATEPWHVEAALEYVLASSYLLRNDPKALEQSLLILDRTYAKYFDHDSEEGKNYWKDVKADPRLQQLMERYAALFNAKSAKLRSQLAEKNGQYDDLLEWNRRTDQYSKVALGNNGSITLFFNNLDLSSP